MQNITIGYGALLVALGVGGFVATGATHKTALIPAGFGAAAIGLGLLAKRSKHRKRALRGARFVARFGLFGSARALKKLPDVLRGREVERPAAVISQSIMAGLSAAYLAVSFGAYLTNRS
jgi:hypothetical protein